MHVNLESGGGCIRGTPTTWILAPLKFSSSLKTYKVMLRCKDTEASAIQDLACLLNFPAMFPHNQRLI